MLQGSCGECDIGTQSPGFLPVRATCGPYFVMLCSSLSELILFRKAPTRLDGLCAIPRGDVLGLLDIDPSALFPRSQPRQCFAGTDWRHGWSCHNSHLRHKSLRVSAFRPA